MHVSYKYHDIDWKLLNKTRLHKFIQQLFVVLNKITANITTQYYPHCSRFRSNLIWKYAAVNLNTGLPQIIPYTPTYFCFNCLYNIRLRVQIRKLKITVSVIWCLVIWYISVELYGVTSQKTAIVIATAVKTSYLTIHPSPSSCSPSWIHCFQTLGTHTHTYLEVQSKVDVEHECVWGAWE
jgi:hypothetical protein